MLLPVQHLVLRLRHVRSRADEVHAVRRRLVASDDVRTASPDERALAERLRELRVELTEAFGAVTSCGGCARGRPLPHGRWRGGFCCGGRTEELFTDDELASLRLAGTTPARLAPPRGDHAGCAFRGEEGCSLVVDDRPNLCVRFACRELEGELRESGELTRVKALARELGETFARFAALRAASESAKETP